jgi:tetratricopeptide (TPR) repeat protein
MWSAHALRRAAKAVAVGARSLRAGDLDAAGRAYAGALATLGKRIGRHPAAAGLAAAAHLGLGRVRLAYGDFFAADPEFLAVQQLQPHDLAGFHWAGCAAAHRADFPRADWYFTAALARDPLSSRTLAQRGLVRIRLGQLDAAVADLESARQLHNHELIVLAALHLRRRDWARAEAVLVAMPPESRPPAMLADALARQDKHEPALAAYDQAIAAGDRSPAVLFHHGLVAYQLGRYEQSVRSWTELCQRHPKGRSYQGLVVRAEYAAACQLVNAGQYEAALPKLAAGLTAQPPGALDAALGRLRRYAAAEAADTGDQAGRARARALVADADDPWARDFLILLDRLDGRPQAAEQAWVRINAQRPADARTLYALGLCSAARGDSRAALTTFAVLANDESPVIARRSRRALAALRIRHGDWAKAAAALAPLPDDRWRAALLPESAYRAGDPDRHAAQLGPWQAAVRTAEGEPTSAVDVLSGSDGPPRLRRELALLVRKAALADVIEARWNTAAELLSMDGSELLRGVVRVLGGSRSEGIRLLADAAKRHPLDRGLTHTLALAQLHTVSAAEPLPDASDWAQCVATWAALLHDDGFWTGVRSDAADRYGVEVPDDTIEPLRIALRDLLADRLPTSGRASLLYQRELAAAEVLADRGGLPLTDDDVLVCGPLRLAELGLHQEFGRFAVRTIAELNDLISADHPEARRLVSIGDQFVRCFSQLGFAHCLLVADQPAAALLELADLRCPNCRTNAPPESADLVRPLICPPDCAGFEQANPAYAGLPDGREQLAHDAVTLAMDALRMLSRRGQPEQAIPALETALLVLTGESRDRVASWLASLLTDRGVRAANENLITVTDDDLRRAVELDPHLIRARHSLCVVLRNGLVPLLEQGQVPEALRVLREVTDLLNEGLRLAPGNQELTQLLDKVTLECDQLSAAEAARRAGPVTIGGSGSA